MSAAPDTLMLALRNGGSLRFRPPHGFYVVLAGQRVLISQGAAKAAVRAGSVRPSGIDQHGVYLFTTAQKAAHAVPAVRRDSQTLPKRPAGVPNALPIVPALRCPADSKTPAPVPTHHGAAPGLVQGGAGGLDGAGAQRAGAAGAGKANGVGCGGEGVTA